MNEQATQQTNQQPHVLAAWGPFLEEPATLSEFQAREGAIAVTGTTDIVNALRPVPGLQRLANLGMGDLQAIRAGEQVTPLAEKIVGSVVSSRAHEEGFQIMPDGRLQKANVADLYAGMEREDMPVRGAQDPQEIRHTEYTPGA